MIPSIEKFKTTFSNGVARPNKFIMRFTLPLALELNYPSLEFLELRCHTAELPGISVPTTERKTYGSVRKLPYSDIITGDLTVQFYCSDDLRERNIFEDWLLYNVSDFNTFNVKYYEDYTTLLQIEHFSEDATQNTNSYLFWEAYPINIDTQTLSWNENDSILNLSVTFAYRYWKNLRSE